jgi:hypothetical protein
MDIKLTEQNWRIAGKIVLHELRQKQLLITTRMEESERIFPDYALSSMKVMDEFELEMVNRGITALSDILL